MIPLPVITNWRKLANWPSDDQVEQDLIISRVLVELFNNKYISEKVAFRGGTALHKLVFPKALRYSEDIDLNRLETGSIKPLLVSIKNALKECFGTKRSVIKTENSVKLIYSYEPIGGGTRNLKIEINIRETLPQQTLEKTPFKVDSEYFRGSTNLYVFNHEEMVGTKIRALYQRKKGRDLFDLFQAKDLKLNWTRVIEAYKFLKIAATRMQYEANLNKKMSDPEFLQDIYPLISPNIKYDPKDAYNWFKEKILPNL
jgi:predicted nucleotidyltransferase component of viral defense system